VYDLLVQSKFRNNILWNLLEGRPVSEVAKQVDVSQSAFGQYLNLASSPWNQRTQKYRVSAQRIADYFKLPVEDLFPLSLYSLNLPSVINREYESVEVSLQFAAGMQSMLPMPDELAEQEELRLAMRAVVETLPSRQQLILEKRGAGYTLEEIGKELNLSRDRIRQIENQALKNLRKPSLSKILLPFLPKRVE
jgi:RNA polymerase sigma factor (sigma-70 family)